jgi:hypothetical protein
MLNGLVSDGPPHPSQSTSPPSWPHLVAVQSTATGVARMNATRDVVRAALVRAGLTLRPVAVLARPTTHSSTAVHAKRHGAAETYRRNTDWYWQQLIWQDGCRRVVPWRSGGCCREEHGTTRVITTGATKSPWGRRTD